MSTEPKSEKENATVPSVNPDFESLKPQYEFAKEMVSNIIHEPHKRKSAAIIVAGILLIAISSFFLLISVMIIFMAHGFTVLGGLWNFAVAIFTIITGIAVIRHKIWARKWALGACAGNITMVIIQWSSGDLVALLILTSFYVAALLLIILNFNRFQEEDIFDTELIIQKINETEEKEANELKELNDSKEKGLISESEYEQKTIEIKVKRKTDTIVEKLWQQKNNAMLTEEEFQTKKQQIILEKQQEVELEMRLEKEQQQLHAQRLSQIPNERIEKLSVTNRAKLEKYIDTLRQTDLIVFHDQKIKLIDAERWAAIIEANTEDRFEIIFSLQTS